MQKDAIVVAESREDTMRVTKNANAVKDGFLGCGALIFPLVMGFCLLLSALIVGIGMTITYPVRHWKPKKSLQKS